MKPRWRKVLRDVWQHKSRTSLVTLAIAVGIAGAGTILDAWSLVRQGTRGEFQASNPASATLRTDSIDAALIRRIRGIPQLRNVQARRRVIGAAYTARGRQTAVLFAYDDPAAITIGKIARERGSWPPPDGAVVLEQSSLEFAGTDAGDSLGVQLGRGPTRMLRVAGVARDVGLAPGWMEHVVYGFVSRATLAQLGAPGTLDELQLTVRDSSLDRAAIRRIAYDVKSRLEANGHRVTDVDVPAPGVHIHAAQIESLLYTQGAFAIMSLVLSGILVVNLIAAMLTGQVREIGVMKAVGATSGQIAAMYLGLALGLGLVASLVALPAAALIGTAYAGFTAELLNFDVKAFSIPWTAYGAQLAVGLLLPVAAAAIPVAGGCKISVGAALRDVGLSARHDHASRLLYRAAGVSRPMLLALRSAFRRRGRMILTVFALSAGGAAYVAARDLRASIQRSVDVIFSAQRFDFSLTLATLHSAADLEAQLARLPNIRRAEAYTSGHGAIERPDGTLGNTFAFVAPSPATQLITPYIDAGRWLRTGDTNAIVINRRIVADEPLLRVGSAVTTLVGGRDITWRIAGVAETGPSPMAFVTRDALVAAIGARGVDRVAVAAMTHDPESLLALVLRLRSELADRGFAVQASELTQQNRRVIEDHLLMVVNFLGVVSRLMILVGGLGLAATMSIAVLERRREIGVLRAIGARHGAIVGMIEIEGLVIALASWVVSLPLSIPMSVLLESAFGRVMFRVPVAYLPETPAALRWLGVVVVVSVVSCAWPALAALRVSTSEALAYE